MKITNKKALGLHQVYDIGCEEYHNFTITSDGYSLVAHNCFNASHSVAYSHISWVTAYLKANYPADFMAALLSCESNNLDEIEKSISAAKEMGINVIHPDINESMFEFTRLNDKTIRFGLSAIKGLGEQIVKQIINERLINGKFADFPDLIRRVQLNKRATDGLIYSGAIDCFCKNRYQLIKDADLLLEWSRSLTKSKNSGQMSLFDVGSSAPLAPPKSQPVEDFSLEEKNTKESEYLGICLNKKFDFSDIDLISGFCDEIESIKHLENDKNAVFVARITSIKSTTIKNGAQQGKMMAFLKLSDNSSEIEAVMFPNAYDLYGLKLRTDTSFLINGVISQKDDEDKQIIINNMCEPNDVNFIVCYVDDHEIDKHTIKTAISFKRGEMPLILWYRGKIIRCGKWINEDAIDILLNLGISAVKTPSKEIKNYLEIFESVDMLRNAKDWHTIKELSVCFSMISDDYGKIVWNYTPKSVRKHVNALKESVPVTA